MSTQEFNDRIEGAMNRARAYCLTKYEISKADLDDVLQEASLKAMQNLQSFQGKCSFETWFIAICKSEVLVFFRRSKRHESFVSQDDPDLHKDLNWNEPEVLNKSLLEERSFIMARAMSKLSDKHRQIIEIALKDSSSFQEIADLLKIPVSSARTRLHYAKKRLAQLVRIHAHKSNPEHALY